MKVKTFGLWCICSVIFFSCVTNKGMFDSSVPREQQATLKIDSEITVTQFDDQNVNWEQNSLKKIVGVGVGHTTINVPAGIHTLGCNFNSHSNSRNKTAAIYVAYNFIAGETYSIDAVRDKKNQLKVVAKNSKGKVIPSAYDNDTTENPLESLFAYVRAVVEPCSKEVSHSVVLENNEYKLIMKPDMKYVLTNKKTKRTTSGRNGFIIPANDQSAPNVYLVEDADKGMTTKEFLKESNYMALSQIVWSLENCDEKTVTFTYVKPQKSAGKNIEFTIRELE